MHSRTRKNLTALAVICFVLSMLSGSARTSILAAAQRQVDAVGAQAQVLRRDLAAQELALARVRQTHLPGYLKEVALSAEQELIDQARRLIKQATAARHPLEKEQLSQSAASLLQRTVPKLASHAGYFKLLDDALKEYPHAPGSLKDRIGRHRAAIARLEAQGYFSTHFDEAGKLLSEASRFGDRAQRLSDTPFERGKPDYLSVYRTCLEGQRIAGEGLKAAEAVPAMRQSNGASIRRLRESVAHADAQYLEARVAATFLTRYPPYHCVREVEKARSDLAPVTNRLAHAESLNSMERQQFKQAAELLGTVETTVSSSQQTFEKAIADRQEVTAAAEQLENAKANADSEISRADSHIRAYSQNSQRQAKSHLHSARSEYGNAESLYHTDPPLSLKAFEHAAALAQTAYSSVDTADHSSGSSHSSSGGYSFGGGGGGGGGGGYSGGFSGGGSFGGGYGGPSGGGFGGPSGGGVGSGGL